MNGVAYGVAYTNGDDAWVVHADNTGNLISSKLLGSTKQDWGEMIYPLSGGGVIAGGYYSKNDNAFSSLTNYGDIDAFLAVFAPWTSGIEDPDGKLLALNIIPNPACSSIQISFPTKGMGNLTITNSIGRQVYIAATTAQAITINTTSWLPGLYVVKWLGANGTTLVTKLTVN